MNKAFVPTSAEKEQETREWLESMEWVLRSQGPTRAREVLHELQIFLQQRGVDLPGSITTPYINTIPHDKQPPYPGSRELERRIKSIIRWNAMAMVVRANKSTNVGGHISTFASSATLYEVAQNHILRCRSDEYGGDLVYFQGHASPGMYARAFVEGRLSEEQLEHFRQELKPGGGLSSYPHPWLMPDFWQFPTVSMGLGPITAIYQARFMRYLEDRGLKPRNGGRVYAYLGDGECDEPETLGAITLASREKLDNLCFVINCNLQRLDGPVRGNGKIIQELEGAFSGAGWNVVKVIWGDDWDALLEHADATMLIERMEETVDGEYQKFTVSSGDEVRQAFFGKHPELLAMVQNLSDEQIAKMRRGGHDPEKVYAAYAAALAHQGAPTVILAKTIKGYGLGEAGEGMNITHQQKKLNEEELRQFRSRFGIPISDDEVAKAPFYRPPADSPEMKYLRERREALGGFLPSRQAHVEPLEMPDDKAFAELYKSTGDRAQSTTVAYVRLLRGLLGDANVGKLVVPIVPDEARTFGMDPLFRQFGIYAHTGQLYEPVDSDQFLYYKEAKDGQILEEGITEAGSMSSFIAAGTAYSNHGINTIPFFIYYSMFGFQRVGDLIWLAGDSRCRGFLLGATAGRTTLNGEGLQHQDGHSHLLASTVPNCRAYDPAFAYEIATIVRAGLEEMYVRQESKFYYLTLHNENYRMPEMPEGVEDGITRGIYRCQVSANAGKRGWQRAHLFGSGAIMTQVLAAVELLAKYKVAADVWSVTSYTELRRDGLDVERWNLLHPGEEPRVPYVTQILADEDGAFVAASDYQKALPDGIRQWIPGSFVTLGTDGFGRSDTREALRDFFEVDARFVAFGALTALHRAGKLKREVLTKAIADLEIDPDKLNPMVS